MIEKCLVCRYACKAKDIMVAYCCDKFKMEKKRLKKKVKRMKQLNLAI